MQHFLTVLALLVILGLTPCAAVGAPAKAARPSDTEIYSAALQSLRTARINELESLLSGRQRSARSNSRSRKAATRARAELKRLKSDKPLPRNWGVRYLRIEVNAPRVGQVGGLTWGKMDDRFEKKKCTIKHIVSGSSVLIQTQWAIVNKVILRNNKNIKSFHNPSTVNFGDTRIEGPSLLLTNVRTAGLRPGIEVKTSDVFVVERMRDMDGGPVFVLRRLEIK